MSDKPAYFSPAEVGSIFARLNPQDVEQFYRSYHLWALQQQITGLQGQITAVQQQIAENNKQKQKVHPSAIALATLARLQSNGVNDIDLLDRMLERGEAWLDRTMQRLAYCEQSDFIRNNYTEWCENALDGAYDWIDSMQEDTMSSSLEEPALTGTPSAGTNDSLSEATEEILLQKLMSEEEDEALLLEPTLKRPTVFPVDEAAEPEIQTDEPAEDFIPAGFSDLPDSSHVPIVQALEVEEVEHIPASEEAAPGEAEAQDTLPTPVLPLDKPWQWDEPMPSSSHQVVTQQNNQQILQPAKSRQKRNFLQRLFSVFSRR